ncbi:hypothetical protein Bca4012_088029 [Brassica carinata]|uniref:Annexin n=1 Tax=Brassica carinata TaxID=52824 RepID=A0A8X7TQP5_BRACI|nr:hypothetical protein Bca52824_088289 [Brassica carinata]
MRIFLKKVWSVVELCRTEVTNYDLQGSTRVHHHNPNSKPLEGLPFTVLTAQTCNHNMPLTEQHKEERENSVSYVLRNAINTVGTDEDALTRVIVSRADKDLKKTTEPYHKRNNESLDQAIAKKTSRDYKAFLLALLGNGGI